MTLATQTAPDTDMDTPPEHRSAASTDAVPPMARHGRVIDEPPVVLVVDDDRALCAALQRAFLRQGWQVYCANTYAEALARCRMVRPDMLLTDQALPDGAGLDLLQALLATDPDLAGILMSAYADIAITVDAMRAGAVTVLAKPLALDYLVEVVTRAAQIARLRRRDRLSQLHPGTLDALDALGHCRRMRDVAQELLTLAPGRTPVLLQGETGTGKGHAARLLHQLSPRRRAPFVELNCASLTPALFESELLGHERGAFTDAKDTKRGLLELADGGTLFLDEVNELQPDVQPKLLKVIEEMRFRRLGGVTEREVDVRLVLASNRPLLAEVQQGRFRTDLYYRLAGGTITIPPLRERDPEEILRLAQVFLLEEQRSVGRGPARIGEKTAQAIVAYYWPGNVRELRAVISTAVLRAVNDAELEVRHLRLAPPLSPQAATEHLEGTLSLRELERLHIARVLVRTGGNRLRTARILGITRTTLYKKLADYELDGVGRSESPG